MITTTYEFLQELYPDPVSPGQLVVWTCSKARGTKHSQWVRTLDEAAEYATDTLPVQHKCLHLSVFCL